MKTITLQIEEIIPGTPLPKREVLAWNKRGMRITGILEWDLLEKKAICRSIHDHYAWIANVTHYIVLPNLPSEI